MELFKYLFCCKVGKFIGETRDFLHGIFRTGKAHSCRGVKRFVDECLKMIPEGIRGIFLRADSGFYDGDFLYYLEMKRVLFLPMEIEVFGERIGLDNRLFF